MTSSCSFWFLSSLHSLVKEALCCGDVELDRLFLADSNLTSRSASSKMSRSRDTAAQADAFQTDDVPDTSCQTQPSNGSFYGVCFPTNFQCEHLMMEATRNSCAISVLLGQEGLRLWLSALTYAKLCLQHCPLDFQLLCVARMSYDLLSSLLAYSPQSLFCIDVPG